MATYIALLRAVNLGAHNRIAMADLRDLVEHVGGVEPRTLLQSGNVVFESGARSAAKLEAALEAEARKRLDLNTGFFVRTAKEWGAVMERNPFPREAARDPAHLLVMALKEAPSAAQAKALAAFEGPEKARVDGRHAYLVYPNGVGRSKLTVALIERKLGTRGTARNWNTVGKLMALAQED